MPFHLTRFPNTARPGYAPCPRRFLFTPYTIFPAMVLGKVTNNTLHAFAAKDMLFFRMRGGFFVAGSSWQDGGCATHNPVLPKAPPLDSAKAFGASLLTLSEKRKNRHEKKRGETCPVLPVKKKTETRPSPPSEREARKKCPVFAEKGLQSCRVNASASSCETASSVVRTIRTTLPSIMAFTELWPVSPALRKSVRMPMTGIPLA